MSENNTSPPVPVRRAGQSQDKTLPLNTSWPQSSNTARNANTLPNVSKPQPIPRKRCSSSSSRSPTTPIINNQTNIGLTRSTSKPSNADVGPDDEEDIYSENTAVRESVSPVVAPQPAYSNISGNGNEQLSMGFKSTGFQPVQTDAVLRQSGHDRVLPTVGEVDRVEKEMSKMNLEDIQMQRVHLEEEVIRLTQRVDALRREETGLMARISQLNQQGGVSVAREEMERKEREFREHEKEFYLRQQRFESEVGDREFRMTKRESELQHLEDQLVMKKKELDHREFDLMDSSGGAGAMSSKQLAELADKELALQKRESDIQLQENRLREWAISLDQQSNTNQQRFKEIERREADLQFQMKPHTFTSPVSALPTQYEPPMAGYNMSHTAVHNPPPVHTSTGYIHPTPAPTPASQVDYPHYQQQQQQPIPSNPPAHLGELQGHPHSQYGVQSPPYRVTSSPALAQSGVSPHHHHLGHHSSSAQPLGDHMYSQQQQQLGHHASSTQYGVVGGNHTLNQPFGTTGHGVNHTQPHLTAATGVGRGSGGQHIPSQPYHGASSQQQFSVGQQHVQPLGDVASTGASGSGPSRSAAHKTATINPDEEVAKAIEMVTRKQQTEMQQQQLSADEELAKRLQAEFEKEERSRGTDHDELLAIQLQQEDLQLQENYGSGLTITNQLISSGGGGAKSDESGPSHIKKLLDEKLAREQERKQQEERDFELAQQLSKGSANPAAGNDLGSAPT